MPFSAIARIHLSFLTTGVPPPHYAAPRFCEKTGVPAGCGFAATLAQRSRNWQALTATEGSMRQQAVEKLSLREKTSMLHKDRCIGQGGDAGNLSVAILC
jgi:hypothetical protein